MYTLYGFKGSGSTAVEVALHAAALPYRIVQAASWEPSSALDVFIAADCYSAISISDYPERRTAATDKAAHEALRVGTRAQLHRHWEIFADTFAADPYLSGPTPGALDFLAVVVSKWSGTRAHLQQHRADFFATLQRIEAHERVAPVFRAHWAT